MHATELIAKLLKILDIDTVFGLVGIPIVQLADELQKEGIHFISHRSESAATYAATGYAFLTYFKTFRPGIALCTSGPGMINALAGLTHATINRIPFLLLGGSAALLERNKGAFQELDQFELCKRLCELDLCKASYACLTTQCIAKNLVQAISTAIKNPPGGVYVDFPRDILEANIEENDFIQNVYHVQEASKKLIPTKIPLSPEETELWEKVLLNIKEASKPLLVVGEAVALEGAEILIEKLCSTLNIPVLPCPMARGIIKDLHPLCMTPIRSLVLQEADFVILIGAQLNWMLHFGEVPRWNPDVKFVVIDYFNKKLRSTTLQREQVIALFDNGSSLYFLIEEFQFYAQLYKSSSEHLIKKRNNWIEFLKEQKQSKLQLQEAKLKSIWSDNKIRLSKNNTYVSFSEAYLLLQHELELWRTKGFETSKKITIVAEGARTMDLSRVFLKINHARGRLDAGQWGTMGCGLAYVLAAYLAGLKEPSVDHLVIAVEGDSAIGFSLAELETLTRYKINALIIVFDNGGIYSGKKSHGNADPLPTQLTHGTGYEMIMEGVGGKGFRANNLDEYQVALKQSFSMNGARLLHVMIDPNEEVVPTLLKY